MYNLRTQLLQYNPTNPYEIDAKQRMIEFYDRYEDRFERTLLGGHFTASGWLLNPAKTHVLLMHHKKLNMWIQPGGHCDGNPNVLEVAIKEAEEESGMCGITAMHHDIFDIDIHLIPARKNEPEHFHYDVRFLLQAPTNIFFKNDESHSLQWIALKSSQWPTNESSIIRMVEKSRNIDHTL